MLDPPKGKDRRRPMPSTLDSAGLKQVSDKKGGSPHRTRNSANSKLN